jgi:hypothetical protein
MKDMTLCNVCYGWGYIDTSEPYYEELDCIACKHTGFVSGAPPKDPYIETITLDREDWDRFMDAIENPKPPTKALVDAMKKYRKKYND